MIQSTIALNEGLSKRWIKFRFLIPFFIGTIVLPFSAFPFFLTWDSSKWVVLYGITAISLLCLPRHFQFYVPHLSQLQKILLVSIFIALCWNFFYHNSSLFQKEFTDRLLFWALFFYFGSALQFTEVADKKYLYFPLFFGTGLFITYAILNSLFGDQNLAFTFFNINKAAEFVGFSLALQLGLFMYYSERGKKILSLLIILSIDYLYYAKCRSAFLGIIFVLAYLIFAQKIRLRSMIYIILGAILSIFFLELIEFQTQEILPSFVLKNGSSSERWKIITNTLFLIRDFPLGVGLGRYEFAAAPYMQNLSVHSFNEYNNDFFSPHNEVLRFLSEEGILASFFIFLFFASFLLPFRKLKNISEKCPESITFFLFFIPQFLFQFPLIQPFPLLLIPFVLAYTMHYTHNLTSLSLPAFQWTSRIFGGFFFLFLIGMSISLYISRHHFHDTELNKEFYELWRSKEIVKNIIFCTYVNKNFKDTKEYALKILKEEPQDLQAMKYLGLSLVSTGEQKKGCPYLKFYEASHPQKTSAHEKIQKFCSGKNE